MHNAMRILHLEGTAAASHLRWSGAEIPPRSTKKGRAGGDVAILENDCSPLDATATSCVVFDKHRGCPLWKSEVRIVGERSFVENAISSLKRLGTSAYRTQVRRPLPQRSEGRRILFVRRGLRGARGIRFAVFQKLCGSSVQKI
jgi:hypothetical protein